MPKGHKMKSKKAKKAPKKGVAGKGTGPKTRAAIKAAQKKGSTIKQIASAARRDPSTISAIASGEIKNPPANLAGLIKKAKASK